MILSRLASGCAKDDGVTSWQALTAGRYMNRGTRCYV